MDLTDVRRALDASPALRDEIERAARAGLAVLEVPPPLRLSTWMEKYFYMSEESSYTKGAWTFYPYQVAIADCIGHDGISHVTWRKSARTGYTKIILGAICYYAEHKRRNQVVYQPTDEDRDDFTTTDLEPALRDVKIMRRAFPKVNRKSKDNTMKKKRFIGCLLHLRGGKAAKNYRRITVDNVYYDETDGFDRDIEKEGSPFKLGDKRIEGATFPKSVAGSTPKLKGFSLIEDREAEADERFRYYVRCVHCDAEHTLEWGKRGGVGGMKWRDNDPSTAAHACPQCGGLITQAEYLRNWRGRWKTDEGLWIDESDPDTLRFRTPDGAEVAPPGHVAFFAWTAYSPQASWPALVKEFLDAVRKAKAGDDSDLKTFVNTTKGETYEVELEKTEANQLQGRVESYALGVVPRGAVVVTAGVDVQGDRWEIVKWAWGRGEESWAIDYIVIYGNPADPREWQEKLLPQLDAPLRHACGASMKLEATAIDTGGHFTHQAYSFVRANAARRFFAVKGDSGESRPVKGRSSRQDVAINGKVIPRGVQLWMVGTDTAKDLLHGRFKVAQPGPGYVHFSNQLPPEFFKQITSESRIQTKSAAGERFRWVKPSGARNEVLDCTVYATFAAHAIDLHRYTDKMWQRLELAFEGDLFDHQPDQVSGEAEAVHVRALPGPNAQLTSSPPPAETPPPPRRVAQQAPIQRPREW